MAQWQAFALASLILSPLTLALSTACGSSSVCNGLDVHQGTLFDSISNFCSKNRDFTLNKATTLKDGLYDDYSTLLYYLKAELVQSCADQAKIDASCEDALKGTFQNCTENGGRGGASQAGCITYTFTPACPPYAPGYCFINMTAKNGGKDGFSALILDARNKTKGQVNNARSSNGEAIFVPSKLPWPVTFLPDLLQSPKNFTFMYGLSRWFALDDASCNTYNFQGGSDIVSTCHFRCPKEDGRPTDGSMDVSQWSKPWSS